MLMIISKISQEISQVLDYRGSFSKTFRAKFNHQELEVKVQ